MSDPVDKAVRCPVADDKLKRRENTVNARWCKLLAATFGEEVLGGPAGSLKDSDVVLRVEKVVQVRLAEAQVEEIKTVITWIGQLTDFRGPMQSMFHRSMQRQMELEATLASLRTRQTEGGR